MKIYICDPGAHHKNVESLRNMMAHNKVEYVSCHDLSKIDDSFDVAICCTHFFSPDMFPARCKVLYGPQFFVFPNNMNHPIHKYTYDPARFFYNTLADWNLTVHKSMAPALTLSFVPVPLGLNMAAIKEVPALEHRTKIMIYSKSRHPSVLTTVTTFLKEIHIDYYLIQYGSYNDADFKQKLQDTRFIIWVGRHESQGFAFQEAQASNVPILLWDVTSMRDEYVNGWPYGQSTGTVDDLAATVANCWSDECGVKFYKAEELAIAFAQMNERLPTFTPRKYIADKLSLSATYQNLLRAIGL
jgi:glycosyltransferase involved in cell wall biosynthesis